MTKLKVSELSGAALDWAVAKCEGRPVVNNPEQGDWKQVGWWQCGPNAWQPLNAYSSNWTQGGPIIEREKVNLKQGVGVLPGAFILISEQPIKWFSGETPLIAAMRCYVASKLGEEVDIPNELAD